MEHGTQTAEPCPDTRLLADFHRGRLSGDDLNRVASHVSACANCQAALRMLAAGGEDGFLRDLKQCLANPADPADSGYAAMEAAALAIGGATHSTQADTARERWAEQWVGRTIGHFLVLGGLGQGGMGMVFLARQESIGQTVALKMIRDDRCTGEHALARFKTEGVALARLTHPNVVRLYDFAEHDGLPYFTMELVEGESLEARIGRVRFPPREAAELVRTLAGAVEYLHAAGVLHRDLKPANVLVAADGTPKITDFGLAKVLDPDGETATDRGRTETGAVFGTPSYMAPEQAEGRTREIGPPTDVYGLGGILYAALTGRPPFMGTNPEDTRRLVCTTDPVPPSQVCRECPRGLEWVCLKCLQKRPDRRYPTAKDLSVALTACLEGRLPRDMPGAFGRALRAAGITRRRAIAAGIGSALVAGGLFGYRWWADPERLLRRVERELAAGRPVTLIPKTGFPVRFVVLNGDEMTTTGLGENGPFFVSSWSKTSCLVELLPRVPAGRYRFRVDIRHEQSETVGHVGLYCAAQALPGATRPIHVFGYANYNDVLSPAKDEALRVKESMRRKGQLELADKLVVPDKNSVKLGTGMIGEREELGGWTSGAPFRWAGSQPEWRTLELTVTPAEFSAMWNGKEVGTMSAGAATKMLTDMTGEQTQYTPGGGLGLMLFRGSAEFKTATITPLTTEPQLG